MRLLGVLLLAQVLLLSVQAGASSTVLEQLARQHPQHHILQLPPTTTSALYKALAAAWKSSSSVVVVLGPTNSSQEGPGAALLVDKALNLGPGQSLVLTTPAALLAAQQAQQRPGGAIGAVDKGVDRSALLQVNCQTSDTGSFLSTRDAASVELRGLSIQRCPGPALGLKGGGRLVLQDVELARHNLEVAAPSGAVEAYDMQQIIVHRLRCRTNKATLAGGCIRAVRVADMRVSSSLFLANMKDGRDNAGGGGALAVEHARSVVITNSTFKHSWAFGTGSKGGGALLDGVQKVVLRECVFEDCTATEQGGGVYARNPKELLVQGCNFTGNGRIPREVLQEVVGTATIPKTGAGLDIDGTSPVWPLNVTVTHCRFDSNTARGSSAMGASQSGLGLSHITISHCTFYNNSGVIESGGLGVGAANKGVLQVLHSNFTSNVGARGAAMGVGMQDLLVADTRFVGNKAFREGGAVMTDSSKAAFKKGSTTTVFERVLFMNNSCSRRHGALVVKQQHLRMRHVDFVGNSASTGAGAASLLEVPKAVLTNVSFRANLATTAGIGGLSARSVEELVMHNASFQGNKGHQGAAMGLLSVAAAQLEQLQLSNNTAQEAGGAMAIQRCGNVRLLDSKVLSNTAAVAGGLAADSSTLELTSVHFVANSASQQQQANASTSAAVFASAVYGHGAAGGALLQRCGLLLANCSFDSSVAESEGGALLLWKPRYTDMQSCNFSNNSAVSGSGGAITVRGLSQEAVATNMSSCRFAANRAAGSGGAVLLDASLGMLLLHMHSCTFADNVAGAEGGALAAVGPCHVSCTNCSATNNTAANAGGWVSCRGCSRLATESCRWEGNRARRSAGGAMQCVACQAVEHVGDVHRGNTAAAGGAVAMEGVSQARIQQCGFERNAAVKDRTAEAKMLSDTRAAAAAAVGAAASLKQQRQHQQQQERAQQQRHQQQKQDQEQVKQQQQQVLSAIEAWPPEWQALCSLKSLLQPAVDATCATEGAGGAVCLHAVGEAVVADSTFSSNAAFSLGGALLASAACPEHQQPGSGSGGSSGGSGGGGGTGSSGAAFDAAAGGGGDSSGGSTGGQAGSCSIQLLGNSIMENTAHEAGGALYTSTPSVLQLSQRDAAAGNRQQQQQQSQQQQELLDQLAQHNTAVGAAYGPGAASVPAEFSLLPGKVAATAASHATPQAVPSSGPAAVAATAAVGTDDGTAAQQPKRRSLLQTEVQLEAGMASGRPSLNSADMQGDLQQTCADLGLTVLGPQHAEVDSYQSFMLPLFLRDAFGSLVTSGPGNNWAVRVQVIKPPKTQAGSKNPELSPSQPSSSVDGGAQLDSPAAAAAPAAAGAGAPPAAEQLVGVARGKLRLGALLLDGLSLNAPPATDVMLGVTAGPGQASAHQALTTLIRLTARPCLPGQSAVITPEPNTNSSARVAATAAGAHAGAGASNAVCVLCPAPSFSFSAYMEGSPLGGPSSSSIPDDSQLLPLAATAQHSSNGPCRACPPLGVCVAGMLIPAQGAYHQHPRSATITPCPMTKACQRGAAAVRQLQAFQCHTRRILDPAAIDVAPYAAAQCSKGYAGPLCSSCYRPGRNRQLQQQQQLVSDHARQRAPGFHPTEPPTAAIAGAGRLAATGPLLAAASSSNSTAATTATRWPQHGSYSKSSGRCLPCMHAAVAWLLFLLCRLLDAALIALLAALWLFLGQLSKSPAAAALEALEAEWRQKQHTASSSTTHSAGRIFGQKKARQQQQQHSGQADAAASVGAASSSSTSRAGSSPAPGRSGSGGRLRVSFSVPCAEPDQPGTEDAAAAAGSGAASSGAAGSGAASSGAAGSGAATSGTLSTGAAGDHSASGVAADAGHALLRSISSQRSAQHRLVRSRSSQSSLSSQGTDSSGRYYNLVQSVSLMFAGAWDLLRRDSAQQAAAGASHIWQSISSRGSLQQQQLRRGSLPSSGTSSTEQSVPWRLGSGGEAALGLTGSLSGHAAGAGLPSYPSISAAAAATAQAASLSSGQQLPATTVWHTATSQDLSVFQLALQQQQPAAGNLGQAAAAGPGVGASHAHSQQQGGPGAACAADVATDIAATAAAAAAAAAAVEGTRAWRRKGVLLLALRSLAGIAQVVLDGWQLAAVVLSADLLLNLPDGIAQGLSAALITQQTTWQWVPFDCLMGADSRASGAAVQSLLVMFLPFLYTALLLPLFWLLLRRPGADPHTHHFTATAAATQQLSGPTDLQAPLPPVSQQQSEVPSKLWTHAVALLLAAFSYCATLYMSTIVGAFTCMPLADPATLPGEVHLQHTAWTPDLQLTCWQGQHWLAVVPVLLPGFPALLAYLLLLLALACPQRSNAATAQVTMSVQAPQQDPSGQHVEHVPQPQQLQDQHPQEDQLPSQQRHQQQHKEHSKQPSCCPVAQELLPSCWGRPVMLLLKLQSYLASRGVDSLSCSPCQLWSSGRGWWWVAAREVVKLAVLAGFWGCALRAPRVQGLLLLLLVLLAAVVALHVQAAASVRMEQWQYGCGVWVVLLAWFVVLLALPGVEAGALGAALLGVVVCAAVLAAVVLGQHVWHVLLVAAPVRLC